jgi:hypothetical protein
MLYGSVRLYGRRQAGMQLFYTGESGLKAPDYIVADAHLPTD